MSSNSIENIGPASVIVFTDKDNVVKAKSLKTGQVVAYASSTNATAAINNAMLSGLTSGRINQETVKLIGHFEINRLSVPSNTVLDATEADLFLISGTNDHMVCNLDGSGAAGGNSGIKIIGGYWNGNQSGNTPNDTNYYVRNQVHFASVTDGVVENATLDNSVGTAVTTVNCFQIRVEKNRMLNQHKLGVYATASGQSGSQNISITDNYMENLVENFAASTYASDVIIARNIGKGTRTTACNVNGARQKIIDNIFVIGSSGFHGIALSPEGTFESDDCEIRGNIVRDVMFGHGIVAGVSNPCDRFTIADNLVTAHALATSGAKIGIRAIATHHSTVTNNRIEGFAGAGLSVEGYNITLSGRLFDTNVVVVTDNVIVNCSRFSGGNASNRVGITLVGDVGFINNVKVANNISYDTSGALGMQLYGLRYANQTDVIINDNDLRNNVSGAIQDGAGNVNSTLYNNLDDPTNNLSGSYYNMTISGATIYSPTISGNVSVPTGGLRIISQSGGTETIARFSVADNAVDALFIENATGGSGLFLPTIRGALTGTNANSPLFNIGSTQSGDTGTSSLIVFDGRMAGGQAVVRPLFSVSSFAIPRVLFMLSGANFQSGMQLNLRDTATFSGSTQLVNTVNFQASGALSTSGTTGSGGALPGNPFGYITIQVSGVNRKIAYYDV